MTDTRSPNPLSLSVSAAYARLLSDWLATRDLNHPVRMKILGTPTGSRVNLLTWAGWLTQVAMEFPGEPVELAIGSNIDFRHVGLLGHLARRMGTLADALDAYARFEALQYGKPWARLVAVPGSHRLVWTDSAGITNLGAESVALASFCVFARERLLLPNVVQSVSFAAPEPANSELWREFFQCPVNFSSGETSLSFRSASLYLPLSHVACNERERLLAITALAAAITTDTTPLIGNILASLQQTLIEGGAQVNRVSIALSLSPRTLHKRVGNAGWKFQQLLDVTRQQLAIHYLEDESLALAEIAFLLGYSEQSAFTRAFHRWVGSPPGKWRLRGHDNPHL